MKGLPIDERGSPDLGKVLELIRVSGRQIYEQKKKKVKAPRYDSIYHDIEISLIKSRRYTNSWVEKTSSIECDNITAI